MMLKASGWASARRVHRTSTTIFKTRIKPCRWIVRAEVGPFCRKGLRSVAATCDLRPDAFPLQNHVAGDHGTAFCFAL